MFIEIIEVVCEVCLFVTRTCVAHSYSKIFHFRFGKYIIIFCPQPKSVKSVVMVAYYIHLCVFLFDLGICAHCQKRTNFQINNQQLQTNVTNIDSTPLKVQTAPNTKVECQRFIFTTVDCLYRNGTHLESWCACRKRALIANKHKNKRNA